MSIFDNKYLFPPIFIIYNKYHTILSKILNYIAKIIQTHYQEIKNNLYAKLIHA